MLERTLWPTQAPETELHIRLPPAPRPLSDVMLDTFDEHHRVVLAAIEPLERMHQWFLEEYDPMLHADFDAMVKDSILLLRAIEALLRTKQRLTTLLQARPAPASNAPDTGSMDTADAAPSATSGNNAHDDDELPIANAAGEVLAWY